MKTRALKTPSTRTLRMKKANFVDIYTHADGRMLAVPASRTEVSITLSDGKILELYAYTLEVIGYWRQYLATIGFKLRRQPLAQLGAQ